VRADLLDAQACVDWALSQLPLLRERIETWRNDAPYRLVEEPHPETGQKLIKLSDVKPIPAIINAEVGSIINSLRSSLDVLVSILAARNGCLGSRDTEFPICPSEDKFFHGKNAGRKKIKQLSQTDQDIIKSLKPWKNGNGHLYALHMLDNTRKHRRLVNFARRPTLTKLWPWGRSGGLEFPPPDQWKGFQDDAVLAWIGIEVTNYQIEFTLDISIDELDLGMVGPDIDMKLNDFVQLAQSIIGRFDN
jgi:hypothetical protein